MDSSNWSGVKRRAWLENLQRLQAEETLLTQEIHDEDFLGQLVYQATGSLAEAKAARLAAYRKKLVEKRVQRSNLT